MKPVTRTYRHVVFARIDDFLAAGWCPGRGLVECHHDAWSILMWRCDPAACICIPAARGKP